MSSNISPMLCAPLKNTLYSLIALSSIPIFNGTPVVCAVIAADVHVVAYGVYAPPMLDVSEKFKFSLANFDISGIKSLSDNPPSCFA